MKLLSKCGLLNDRTSSIYPKSSKEAKSTQQAHTFVNIYAYHSSHLPDLISVTPGFTSIGILLAKYKFT
jgi:hypothetical protein